MLGSLFPTLMPEPAIPSLPFFTRDMLRFGSQAKLELRIDMQADTAATLLISGITREGSFTYKATTPATSLITTQTFGLSDVPIMITVKDAANALEQGSAFVTLSLLVNGDIVQQLTSGYIYAQKALSWPNTQQVDLRPGGGKLSNFVGSDPAAGAEISETVPNGEVWKIKNMQTFLTTNATVGTRRPKFIIAPPVGPAHYLFAAFDQTASTGFAYIIEALGNEQDEVDGDIIKVLMPNEIIAPAGTVISTEINGGTVGDNWTPLKIGYEKYFMTPT